MATTLLSPSAQSDTNTTTANTHSPAPSQSSLHSASTSSTSPSPSTADSPDESKDQLDDSKPSLIHCRWEGCTMTFTNPESIYSHLCDDHVGRKSTGNLCLTCKWVDCEFSCTAKRHHITSHLIVHAPFKPHSCKQCKKSFKRPQDLKKHERTHMQRPTVNYQQLFQAQMMANAPFPYQPQPMVMTTGDGRFYTVSPTAPPPSSDAYAMQLQMAQQMAYPQVTYPGLPQQYHHGQQGLYPMLPQQPRSQSESHPPREVDTGAVSPRSKPAQPRSQSTSVPDTSYLALADSGRSKSTSASVPESDTNSYGYLAHGSSSVAGVKREYEDVGGFFNDVRAKRVAPTYDHAMAQRLCATFGGETIVDPRWMSDESASESGSPAMQPSKTSNTNTSAPNGGKQRLSIPLVLQSNDVAQLNAFLLQLGSSAAGADSSSFDGSSAESMTSGSSAASSPPSSFDFNTALNSYGLTNIPGFDESLLSAPLSCGNAASAEPHQQYDGPSQDYPVSGYNNFTATLPSAGARPIASLPSRAGAPPSYAQSQYARPAYAPLHPPSFDSIRTGRDPALVPQLSPTDAVPHFSYRHVEPLTRADVHPDLAPLPKTDATPSTKAASPRTASPRSRSSSASSTSSDSSCSTCVNASDDSGRTTPSSSAMDAAAAHFGTLGLDAAKAAPAVPTPELRHAHIKLILELLVAINAPKPVAV